MKVVFYVDGEKVGKRTIQAVLDHLSARVQHFNNARECLDSLATEQCHLFVCNTERPATEGVDFLRSAKRITPATPVIILVDHGDIEAAVLAMKSGATDCLERPPEKASLASVIDSALQNADRNSPLRKRPLSKTEEAVLSLILQGNTTAEIARTFGRSRRTIEVHRSHIMKKLEAHSLVDLVRICVRTGLLEDWP